MMKRILPDIVCCSHQQIKVQELEGRLFTEMKKNEEQMEQLRKDIAMHKWVHNIGL